MRSLFAMLALVAVLGSTAACSRQVEVDTGVPQSEITLSVTNNGGSVSEPVVASLNLPQGVSAVGTSRMAGAGLLRLIQMACIEHGQQETDLIGAA